jgi:ABC-type transport system involved in cytochrome c biogenesis permease subunit
MVLRVLISGRPPVTNMYESVVWVAFGAVLFALVFEAFYRVRIFAACASALAVICLILADNVPILDGSISPLVPVLRDNMWLTVHVLTITLGYAAFTLAMGIGHLNLGLYFFRPREVVLFKSLSLFLYRALQVGTLFLAVGTLLGGVWASYSWGRFWGWDPKETWALIATLGYLAILHGRMAGWIKDFGMAVGSLLGYLLVLMAWYGVNFVLGTGLHSYGFGSGGYWYVGGFVAFEVLVITAALLRRRSEMQKHAPGSAPAPAPAH